MSESQNNGVFAPAPRQRLTTGAFKCACAAVTAAIVLAGCEKPAPVVVQTPAPPQVVVAPPSAQGQVDDAKAAADKAADAARDASRAANTSKDAAVDAKDAANKAAAPKN